MNLLGFGKEKVLPSVIKDPFNKRSVKRIYVSMSDLWGRGDAWSANGQVEFTNGNTSGTQQFSGKTFDEVVLQIKAFLEELK